MSVSFYSNFSTLHSHVSFFNRRKRYFFRIHIDRPRYFLKIFGSHTMINFFIGLTTKTCTSGELTVHKIEIFKFLMESDFVLIEK